MGIPAIPSTFGEWSIHAGAQALLLGDHLTEANGGESFEVIGSAGFAAGF